MIKFQSTPLGIGVRLSGNAQQLNTLGDGFIQVAYRHSIEAVGQIIADFGYSLKQSRYGSPVKHTHSIRVSWPRLLYLLHILQKITPPLSDLSAENIVLTILCQRSNEALREWQTKCRMPMSHYVDSSMPLYQGDNIEGLLLLTETAFVRHVPVRDRMNFLATCMDMLSPSAWIHHDTLAFIESMAHNSWHMHLLSSDLAANFSQKRW